MKQNIEEIGTQPNWIIDIKNIAQSYDVIIQDLEEIEIYINNLIKNLEN
jgi:hypothetical protein